MFEGFMYGVGTTVALMIIHWLTSLKDPKCIKDEHYFDNWRISGQDAAQVKTCRYCGFSKKIPLD